MPAVLNKKGGSLCWVKMQIQNIYLFASLLFVHTFIYVFVALSKSIFERNQVGN